MQKLHRCGLSIILILSLLLSGISEIHVYADEANPTQETSEVQETEESPQETQEAADAVQSEVTSEPTSEPTDVQETEITPATEEATPTLEQVNSPTPVLTLFTATNQAEPEEGDPETLPELLESVPEGTDVVILNEAGKIEPLASEEAADTLVEGDPIWCMNGYAPDPSDTAHCTPSFTSFSALIAELSTGAYTGNGTIWIASSYDANQDSAEIIFDGDVLTNMSDDTITFNGGWSGTAGDMTIDTSTPSVLDDALAINWYNNVTLNNIFINSPDSSAGLEIMTDGNVVINNVDITGVSDSSTPQEDGDGAIIYATGNVQITDSTFDSNHGYGLDVGSEGSILVTNISASQNSLMGAYLDTYLSGLGSGSVTVQGGSIFNDNASIELLFAPGLLIESYASTTIDYITAADNRWAGIEIYNGADDINNSISISNVNVTGNYYEGIYLEQNGDGLVSLDNVFAFNNAVGTYIDALYGHADVEIKSSFFVGNLDYGLIVETDRDVTISDTVSGSYGIYGGNGSLGVGIDAVSGNISISNSEFNDNGNAGLEIYNQKSLTLTNVTSTGNTDINILVHADDPKSCYCPCTSFTMNVVGGTYANSDIGIELYSYQSDQLILGTGSNAPTFASNVTNIFHNVTEIPECEDCNCGCGDYEEKNGKPFKIIDVPEGGSGNVPQECSIYAGTILKLADGSYVQVACPYEGFSSLKRISESDLPGGLESGDMFDFGILLGLLGDDGSYVINSDGTITIALTIPAEKRDHKFRMLFWDTAMNDGQGGWFEMPEHHFNGILALHPDNPQDPRRIFSSVRRNRETMTVTVNFAGYFLLVSE